MKKVLLSSLVALMAITTANAAGVSGIASTDYVDNAIGNIEIPEVVDVVADGNGKAVTSNAVADALGAKADKSDIVIKTHTSGSADTITVTDENNTVTVTANVDTAPTANSAKLITSGAVKTALDTKANKETTLLGYGITDAYTKTETDNLLDDKYDANKITVADGAVTIDGTQIATKADISSLPTTGALENKINKTDVDGDLSDATDLLVPSTAAVKTALGTKADKATTYTKTETDGLLDAKADKETTLSGYGITDAYTKTETDGLLGAKADKETTLSGYGITDAYTKTETDGLLGAKADKETTLSGYGITDAYTKTETDGYLNSKVDTAKVFNGTVMGAPDNETTQALIPSVATMSKDVSSLQNAIYDRVDGVEKEAVRVDANKNMIVENNTDYGDCAEGDTCTLVAVRTASGMQSVWKKIFPAAQ